MMTLFRSRQILALILVLFGVEVYAFAASPAPGVERFYIGTYSDHIYVSSLTLGSNKFGTTIVAVLGTNDPFSLQPSFVALSPHLPFFFSVFGNHGTVLSYSLNSPHAALNFF